MTDKTLSDEAKKLTLIVCSGCEACDQAAIFLQGWSNGRSGVELDIVSLEQAPVQVVRFGITHAPALVVNDKLVDQKLSINTLAEWLKTDLNKFEAIPPSTGEL